MVEVTDMTRPIVGIENRTAQEVFDIMCDRIRRASPAEVVEPVVYIIKDVLSELRKHKDASGTVWSGLNTNHPFVKDAVPLYTHPPQQEPARRVRHKKRGTEYDVLGIGKMQAEDWMEREFVSADEPVYGASVDMAEVVVYRSVDDGQIWVRPRSEFEDGRFEPAALAEDGL